MNVGTPGPAPWEVTPELNWYLTPEPPSISMCGLSALMFGWLTTCWGTVAVAAVVVGVVLVVVAPWATASESGARTEQTAAAVAATRTAAEPRTECQRAARRCPPMVRVRFMAAPEYAGTCSVL